MDYKKLSQIICYFPDTRYYKYQQDPRIYIPDVLEKMAKLHGAEYTIISSGASSVIMSEANTAVIAIPIQESK
jgi:hypothetical protein